MVQRATTNMVNIPSTSASNPRDYKIWAKQNSFYTRISQAFLRCSFLSLYLKSMRIPSFCQRFFDYWEIEFGRFLPSVPHRPGTKHIMSAIGLPPIAVNKIKKKWADLQHEHVKMGVDRETITPPKLLAYLIILCFETRRPKQNSIARLNSKYLAVKKLGLATLLQVCCSLGTIKLINGPNGRMNSSGFYW